MNIAEAKEQIKNAVTAYLKKDSRGEYKIPPKKQRPVFLTGAPGIGKTAIMEQIAGELGIGLISYSMIHHTRQSALGLPYIVQKNYGGREVSVSEYTMSEIIAAVYDLMEESGVGEGILFLDEINCVSETLAPAMLQFLQFKTFGRHRLPEGWVVVTAGNPPEYNRSVRAFDVVTLDRLKIMEVTPDFGAWKKYANLHNVHPAVLSYLEIRSGDFCSIETTVDGKEFVTPRGWDDLSEMIKEYEECSLPVNEALIGQYLRSARVAKDFAAYYELHKKYERDYDITAVLNGTADRTLIEKAHSAGFDERLSLTGLLLAAWNRDLTGLSEREARIRIRHEVLKRTGRALKDPAVQKDTTVLLREEIRFLDKKLRSASAASSSTEEERRSLSAVLFDLKQTAESNSFLDTPEENRYPLLKSAFSGEVSSLAEDTEKIKSELDNLIHFAEDAFGDGKEMLILLTDLTNNRKAVSFISRYGCERYFAHNRELLFYNRKNDMEETLSELDL